MEDAVIAHLDHLEARHFSDSHLKQVRRTLRMLALYLNEAFQITDWRAVGERHLRAFGVHTGIQYHSPRGSSNRGGKVSPSTHQYWMRICCKFFRWMKETGRLLHDPAERLELPSRPEMLPRVISEEAMARLIGAADTDTTLGIRDRALMETLYATGIRHGEAHKLLISDVDTVDGRLIVREGKGRKDRVVPLTPTAIQWLVRYIAVARPELAAGKTHGKGWVAKKPLTPSPSLWLNTAGRQLSYEQIWQIIRKYADLAEINANVHTFRHACATHLLRGGASLRHVQRLLGHKSIDTTEIYTHVEVSDLRKVVKVIDGSKVKRAKPEREPTYLNLPCHHCQSKSLVHNGYTVTAKQQYLCRNCGRTSCDNPQSNSYPAERREEILRAYEEQGSLRGVSRTFGIPRETIRRWIRNKIAQASLTQ